MTPRDGQPDGAGGGLAYANLRAIEWLGMHLPRPVGLFMADVYFRYYFARAQRQRAVVARNMAQVLGHPPDSPLVRSATRECFRLYARYWYETFALRAMPADEVNRRFSITGLEHIDRGLAAGRGIVMTLPHMGNWDAAGHWLAVNGYRMTAVAEELKPRSVFELFLRHRRALGMGRVAEQLVGLLAENHVITLVADRDLTGRGVAVEMFGGKRMLPAGPALLSLSTGAPLCVSAIYTTPEGWHCHIDPPTEIDRTGVMREDVTALTHVIAKGFERHIAAAPVDWHMFQPAWDDGPAMAATGQIGPTGR